MSISSSAAQPSSAYYAARRRSIGTPVIRPLELPQRNTQTPPPAPSSPTSQTSTSLLDSTKSESKLLSEINVKNKIIHDLKVKENWLSTELTTFRKTQQHRNGPEQSHDVDYDEDQAIVVNGELDADQSKNIEDLLSKKSLSKREIDEGRVLLFQTLLHFKKELVKAKQAVEQSQALHREAEQQKSIAEESAKYLASLLEARDQGEDVVISIERRRVLELEQKFSQSQTDISSLQSKIALWVRASKRNQEARVQAEACHRTLEIEISALRSELTRLKDSEERAQQRIDEMVASGSVNYDVMDLRAQIADLEGQLAARDERISTNESILENAQNRIIEFEQTMEDAVRTVDELEAENSNLRSELLNREAQLELLNLQLNRMQEEAQNLANSHAEIVTRSRSRGPVDDDAATASGIDNHPFTFAQIEALDNARQAAEKQLSFVQKKLEDTEIELSRLAEDHRLLLLRSPNSDTAAEIIHLREKSDLLAAELQNVSAQHESYLQTIQEETDKAAAAREREIKDLKHAYDSEIAGLTGELEGRKIVHDKDVRELSQSISELKATHEQQLAELTERYEDQIRTLKADSEQLARVNQEHVSNMEQLQSLHQSELEALTRKCQEGIKIAKDSALGQVDSINARKELEALKIQHAKEIAQLREDVNNSTGASVDAIAHLSATLEGVIEERDNEIIRLNAELESLAADHARQLQDSKFEIEENIKRHNTILTELTKSLEASETQHALAISSLHSEYGTKCKEYEEQLDALLKNPDSARSVNNIEDSLVARIESLSLVLESKDAQIKALQFEIEALSSGKAGDGAAVADSIQSQLRNIENLTQIVENGTGSKADSDEGSARIALLTTQAQEAGARAAALESELEKVRSANPEAAEIASLEKTLLDLQQKYELAVLERNNALDSAQTAALQMEELRDDVNILENSLNVANEKTKLLENTVSARTRELEEAQGQLQRLRSDGRTDEQPPELLNQLHETKDMLQSIIIQLQTKNEELETKNQLIEQLKEELEQLQKAAGAHGASSAEEALKLTQQHLNDTFEQLDRVQQERERLQSDNELLQTKMIQLQVGIWTAMWRRQGWVGRPDDEIGSCHRTHWCPR
ncbi:uncharacterized protein BJ171DRAFT_84519 [Polychytrium aggregatum]|uniref:uncharacterized protein n=1 Tax=Polychytrium aggregatum TaxID=110093 RepID=UPI0022FF45A8|nr:uncharacterized protein BJ171DRAFT_84519 [Polychytrium aggregatum]KAI9205188.1 hypothetical protein BJ171DRAFT_84519 [Polychytrium aggregatum]